MSLNRCEFIGNLGADPEVRRLSSGDPVVNLRIAVSETWRDKSSGERKEKTEWVSVVIFNEQIAKVAEQYLRKGSKVFVAGQLATRKWQDQSGNDRYSTEIVLQKFRGELQMLDSKSGDDDRPARQESRPAQRQQSYAEQSGGSYGGGRDLDDETPFAPEWR